MKLKIPRLLLIPLSVLGLSPTHSPAATVIWTGATDASWATPANWNPSAPVSGDTVQFDATSTSNLATLIGAATTVAGITLNGAPAPVSISGSFNLTAGAVNIASGHTLTISNGASAFSASSLSGAGTLVINKSNAFSIGLNAANALNFQGTLQLRGGTAGPSPSGVIGAGGTWFALTGGASTTQAAGTSFALDTGTGTAAGEAKDVIIGGEWNSKVLTLSSLTGYGALRSDSGNAGTRTLIVDQAADTVFNGMLLSHTSTAATPAVRKVAFEKKGGGSLTLAGIVGKQTAAAGAPAADIDLTVSGGTLVLVAANTRTGATTVNSGATLQAGNGGGTGVIGGSVVTNNGAVVFDYGTGATVAIANTFTGNGTIAKNGAGTLNLTGNSAAFSGNLNLNAGSLRMGPNAGSGTLTVKDGTLVFPGLAAASGTSTVGGLTLGNNTGSEFRLGATNDKIEVINTNGLTVPAAGQTHTINILNQPTGGGTVTLIDYSGDALTTEQFNRLALGLLPSGQAVYQLVNNTANTSIDLWITLENQVWKGSTDGSWDTTTTNWALASTPGTPAAFSLDNPALFNDSAAIYAVVIDALGVAPLVTTFDNSANAYTLTGGDIYGAGPLVKKGGNTVTLSQPNAYTGGTTVDAGLLVFDGTANTSSGGVTVNGGRLRIGSGGATGDIGSGAVTVAAGATLEFNRGNAAPGTADLNYKTTPKMRNVSGAGDIVLTGGVMFFNYPGTGTGFSEAGSWANFSGNLTIKGGSEFQTIRNGATAMGSGDLILGDATTGGTLSQIEGNWTWTNDIRLAGGDNRIINRSLNGPRTLKLQGVISGSGGLTLEDATAAMTEINRGFILTGANTLTGTLTVAIGVPLRVGGIPGDTDVNQSGADNSGSLGAATVVNHGTLTFSRKDAHTVGNTISGAGALRVGIPAAANLGDTTTQTVTLTAISTYAGSTTVNNGTLVIAAGAAIAGSGVSVIAGATLSGAGDIAAPLAAAGTIAPGVGIGVLPVTGNTVLTGTLAIEVDGASFDKLAVTGDLDLTGSTLAVAPSGAGFTETSYVIAQCTGTLTGLPAAPAGYSVTAFGGQVVLSKAVGYDAWKITNAGGQGPDLDFDGDGVPNGVEYFMGETGSTFTANPAPVNGKVTWKRDSGNPVSSFKVQVSETLAPGSWTDIKPPHALIDESVAGQVSFILPNDAARNFCRLVVVP